MIEGKDKANTGDQFVYHIWEEQDLFRPGLTDQEKDEVLKYLNHHLAGAIINKANRQEKVDKRNKAVAKNKPSEKALFDAIASFSPEEIQRTQGDGAAMRKLAREIIARREI